MNKNTINTSMKKLIWLAVVFCVMLAAGSDAAAQKKQAKPKAKTTKSKSSTSVSGATPQASATVSIDERPEPLEAIPFTFPAFDEFTMPNGLHVYVIRNDEQPIVTVNVMLRAGEAYDAIGKEGTASVMGDMLGKGAGKRSAAEIALALDNVGASIGASTGAETFTISGSALKKHSALLFGVLADQILRPTFPDEELVKLKQQYAASIANERSRPMELVQALARKVVYGFDNPLARRKTEQSISAIDRADIVQFHGTYLKPNNASIAVVGDVTTAEVKKWLTTHLGTWSKGALPTIEMPDQVVAPAAVYFIPRKGAVQSGVVVTAAAPAQRDAAWPAVDLLAEYMGSGFGSRLFATLRETYSYTYSPFGFVTQGKRYNRIALGAEVRTSVTDSALAVILRELKSVVTYGPDFDDLERKKSFSIGQYRLGMESASTVASLLQYAWANERSLDDVRRETDVIASLTVADVQRAAQRYADMFNLRVVVVGDPSVRSVLEQFGPIKEFTLDLQPAEAAALEPVSQSLADIVARYVTAIGGQGNVDAVRTVSFTGPLTLRFQGTDISGSLTSKRGQPDKAFVSLSTPLFSQKQWVNGGQGWMTLDGKNVAESAADEAKKLMLDELMFAPTRWKELGYVLQPKGKRSGEVIIEGKDPADRAVRFHFDDASGLLIRRETEELSGGELITTIEQYADYRAVGGVLLPHTLRVSNTIFSMECKGQVTVNDVLDGEFRPAD
jgi:zinc protease